MNKSYSKIRHIQETNQRLEKRLLGEQQVDRKQNYLSKGYIDVTDGFKKKTYSLQIPDGTYKCDGAGYSFKIVTNDGKDTGYVVTMMIGVRGMISGPLTVSNNGTSVSVDFGDFDRIAESILYNEKLNQVKVDKIIKEQGTEINHYPGKGNVEKIKPSAAQSGQKTNTTGNDRIANLAAIMSSVQKKQVPQMVIVSDNPKLNNMPWDDYLRGYKITKGEILQAKELLNKFGKKTIVE
jgi:hypothetical protein